MKKRLVRSRNFAIHKKYAMGEFRGPTIVRNIEVVRKATCDCECFYDNGKEQWFEQHRKVEVREIVLTPVMNDGMGHGFDERILDYIPENLEIPLFVHGGIGKPYHLSNLISNKKVDGVAMASALHYEAKSKIKEALNNEGNYAFLNSGRVPKNIEPMTIGEVKALL